MDFLTCSKRAKASANADPSVGCSMSLPECEFRRGSEKKVLRIKLIDIDAPSTRYVVGVYIARFGFEYEPPGGAGAVVDGGWSMDAEQTI